LKRIIEFLYIILVCIAACNRTYYGEIGSTYHLSLSSETIAAALGLNHPQQVDPSHGQSAGASGHGGPALFVCHLTFFAAGDNFGDLVQVSYNTRVKQSYPI